MAKQMEIEQIYENWEESYNKVPKLVHALQSFCPGTICELRAIPYYDGHLMVCDCSMFDKWHKMATVISFLPIAFAIMESKSMESWSFFLTNLRRHVIPQEGLLIISDRSQAIKAPLKADDSGWQPLRVFHAYCIRHMAANFMSHFKSVEGKRYLINVAYSPSKTGYEWYMDTLRGLLQEMANCADRFNKEIWLQHCDRGRWFGHMTTNLSEFINVILKDTWYLPISTIVRITYERLQKLFVMKGREAQS
ncbi:uncharacterized protein [Arachis hypogaea]|uniref:uncharacterized protein n=1 Tax=Arachis hypogaea TaxID=3818 RepID=UPI000DED282B|nr:uncharacterized protein LOC112701560 [Arachis hypogaea]